jgi:hypothetical protein
VDFLHQHRSARARQPGDEHRRPQFERRSRAPITAFLQIETQLRDGGNAQRDAVKQAINAAVG